VRASWRAPECWQVNHPVVTRRQAAQGKDGVYDKRRSCLIAVKAAINHDARLPRGLCELDLIVGWARADSHEQAQGELEPRGKLGL